MKDKDRILVWIGFIMCFFVFLYFFAVTFLTVPKENDNIRNLILGYTSGIISCICGYWYGGSLAPKPIDANKRTEETAEQNDVDNSTSGDDEPDEIDIANAQNNAS